MAPSSGVWAPIAMRVLRHALKKSSNLIKARLAEISRPVNSELQPVLARNGPRHPIHPAALLRQSKGRWYTTQSTVNATVRRFMSSGSTGGIKYDRSSFPKSSVGRAVGRLTSQAPFATTLRPNLTGGALPRTAGGYTIGGGRAGGARYFSHTPTAPAQVVNNVSSAVRAFWLSGQKAQFDGLTSNGDKRYRAVTCLQEETTRKMRSFKKLAPGSYIDFHISPTITALSPLGVTFPFASSVRQEVPTLNTEGFLEVLSIDFSRALKDLAAIMNDLKRLSALGDLAVTLEDKSTLRVRFPGCDAETVEALCDEVGVKRGIIRQDEDFDVSYGGTMALLFPFASSNPPLSSPGGSLRSETGEEYEKILNNILDDTGPLSRLDSQPFDSAILDEYSDTESMYFKGQINPHGSSEFEGVQGIYRFIEECDTRIRA